MDNVYVVGTRVKNQSSIFHITAESFDYREFLELVASEIPKVTYILVRVK